MHQIPLSPQHLLCGRGLTASLFILLVSACGMPPAEAPEDDATAAAVAFAAGEAGPSCPPLPAGESPQATRAYTRANAYRAALGLDCLAPVEAIARAAAQHCGYYTKNRGRCVANPHRQVKGCEDFRAERFDERVKIEGYQGHPAYEAMTYVANGQRAVDAWVDSIWHRVPILSPFVRDVGYGSQGRCDTMEFGWDKVTDRIVTYPAAGQVKVPRGFNGRLESPPPPAPPSGWPSGYPIIVYAAELSVDVHQIFVDGQDQPIPHTWLAPGTAGTGKILKTEFVLYTHELLDPKTRYRVVIEGTRDGSAVRLDWTFTTK